MKHLYKKLLVLLLCLSLVINTTACFDLSRYLPEAHHNTEASEDIIATDGKVNDDKVTANSANKEFNDYLNKLFIENVTSDTINLHYTLKDPSIYGIDHMDATFGEFDIDDFDKYQQELQGFYDELIAFDYDTLDKEQQQIYDIIEQDMSLDLDSYGLEYYTTMFTGTSSLQSNIPIILSEYQFYVQSDIDDYINLLLALPDYTNKACEFETIKSEKGLFMSDISADTAISQCEDFIADKDNNVLIETFDSRIDALDYLSEDEKTSYKDANKEAVMQSVIPSYEKIIDTIKTLKGTGKNDKGLCYYDQGKEYYEYLVASGTGSTRSIEKITDMIDSALENSMKSLYSVYMSNADAYDYYYENDLDYGSDDPQVILDGLEVAMLKYYPEPAKTSYTIKYVHKSLEDTLSPAFYMVPPIDDTVENVIYINGGSNGSSEIFSTLAHEGYPGHLYQTTYFNATNPNPIRSMYNFSGYTEGWATYVEMNCYDLIEFPKYNEELTTLCKAMNEINLAIASRIDIGINYEGWDVNKVSSYLTENGFNGEIAQDIYDYVIDDPANYLKYYLGYLEFCNLENYAKSELGSSFDYKEFHKTLLDAGPCQFNIVKSFVDDYIKESKKSK